MGLGLGHQHHRSSHVVLLAVAVVVVVVVVVVVGRLSVVRHSRVQHRRQLARRPHRRDTPRQPMPLTHCSVSWAGLWCMVPLQDAHGHMLPPLRVRVLRVLRVRVLRVRVRVLRVRVQVLVGVRAPPQGTGVADLASTLHSTMAATRPWHSHLRVCLLAAQTGATMRSATGR